MSETTIQIVSFDPLELRMPAEPGPYSGQIRIELPSVRMTVRRMFGASWGFNDRDNPAVVGDFPGYGVVLTLGDEGSMTAGQLVEFITASKEEFRRAHEIIQGEFDKTGALLDPVM